jgi:hypothetical protein
MGIFAVFHKPLNIPYANAQNRRNQRERKFIKYQFCILTPAYQRALRCNATENPLDLNAKTVKTRV